MNRAVVAICTVSADLAKVLHYCGRKPGLITEEPTAREFFDVMTRRYPDRLNPGTVWLNAQRLA